ncbi:MULTISPECIES: sarcosine oxidase subunit delta [unclassified Rhizobium]|uniref:sarcosine oxidase subunit delta n=1 Tax=unclassified Rhizobium TaxID=2613769 RepID=UPI000EAA78E3|nr:MULTISPECIES: sarcosine oxidase subunit delta [unclassified Rhizobium]AYG70868.1 sarcosine oxidase subunit delta [Rhizobium sp. CCGE531]AYG77183.1 sarcosine oxidase subunit delta [Rhizobium sp. CCGE532]
MKIMICPLNGPRNITEFQCHGEVHHEVDPTSVSDKEWSDYLWMSNNTAGVVREWWCHTPSNYWFLAERNTVTDEILATFAVPADGPLGEVK